MREMLLNTPEVSVDRRGNVRPMTRGWSDDKTWTVPPMARFCVTFMSLTDILKGLMSIGVELVLSIWENW